MVQIWASSVSAFPSKRLTSASDTMSFSTSGSMPKRAGGVLPVQKAILLKRSAGYRTWWFYISDAHLLYYSYSFPESSQEQILVIPGTDGLETFWVMASLTRASIELKSGGGRSHSTSGPSFSLELHKHVQILGLRQHSHQQLKERRKSLIQPHPRKPNPQNRQASSLIITLHIPPSPIHTPERFTTPIPLSHQREFHF